MRAETVEFWALVDRLEAARKNGQVTLLEAVEEVYPAAQGLEAILEREFEARRGAAVRGTGETRTGELPRRGGARDGG